MSKHDKFSPKAIANQQKSKGLQRLRWYCQMCEKQCRDENGFKCHAMSEGHLRQMKVFAENPNSVLDEFSRDFEKGFLQILNHRHGTKRVSANGVYQEYINDKQHVHMNATVWTTLTGFCKYLGKEGKAIVDETEKGWFIQFVDRDPKVLAKQKQIDERRQVELNEEEQHKKIIEEQIRQAELNNVQEIIEDVPADQILKLNVVQTKSKSKIQKSNPFGLEDEDSNQLLEENTKKRSLNSLQILMSENEKRKKVDTETKNISTTVKLNDSKDKSDSNLWITPGILVKIVKFPEDNNLVKQRVCVDRITSDNKAEVTINGEKFRIKQENLQTVVPKVGQKGLILKGPYKNKKAYIEKINVSDYNCDVYLSEDKSKSLKLDYEDISLLY